MTYIKKRLIKQTYIISYIEREVQNKNKQTISQPITTKNIFTNYKYHLLHFNIKSEILGAISH